MSDDIEISRSLGVSFTRDLGIQIDNNPEYKRLNNDEWFGMFVRIPAGENDRRKYLRLMLRKITDFLASLSVDYVDKPFMEIKAPCGHKTVYQKFDDVPLVDVPCPCGNPNHSTIKWKEV